MRLLICLMLIIATTSASALEERMGLDPVLRGLWVLIAESADGGKTITQDGCPRDFAIAGALSIRIPPSTFTITKVQIMEDPDTGELMNVATLSTGFILLFEHTDARKYLVTSFEKTDGGLEERHRWLIRVAK